jgi:hypothetical protein
VKKHNDDAPVQSFLKFDITVKFVMRETRYYVGKTGIAFIVLGTIASLFVIMCLMFLLFRMIGTKEMKNIKFGL